MRTWHPTLGNARSVQSCWVRIHQRSHESLTPSSHSGTICCLLTPKSVLCPWVKSLDTEVMDILVPTLRSGESGCIRNIYPALTCKCRSIHLSTRATCGSDPAQVRSHRGKEHPRRPFGIRCVAACGGPSKGRVRRPSRHFSRQHRADAEDVDPEVDAARRRRTPRPICPRRSTAGFLEDRSLIPRTGRGGSNTFWDNLQQDRFSREGVLKR